MKKISIKNIHILILILGSIFVTISIFHKSLWFDETYSVAIANHNLLEIWKIGGNDVHPVLYYWMLRIVCLLTNGSILAYRVFSAIPIILLGIIGFTYIRKDFGEKTGMFFSLITFFMPMSLVYANQIRMYSWSILIVTLFFIYSYRIYKGESNLKNWILFGIFSLSSMYIHYYGLLTACITNLLLFIYFIKNKKIKDIKYIILIGIIQIILYLPWVLYFMQQLKHVSEGFWITLNLEDKLKIIGAQFVGGANLYLEFGAACTIYLYLLISIIRKRKDIDLKLIIISIAIYISIICLAIFAQIIVKTPILYYRYLFVITGLYIFVLSYMLGKEKNIIVTLLICFILIFMSSINLVYQLKQNYNKQNLEVINFLNEYITNEDEIVYRNIGLGSIIAVNFQNKQYFYNPEDWKVEEAYKAYGPQMDTYITSDFIQNLNNRIWIIDTADESIYNEFFNNENYNIIVNKCITTNYYEEYSYNIKLIEKK